MTRRRRGSISLEAVLGLPILLVLFGAVSQFMLLAQSRIYVEQAAYAAARAAIVYKCPDTDLIAAFQSPFVTLLGAACVSQPQKWEDAARWALVPAAASSGFSTGRGACPQITAGRQLLMADASLGSLGAAVSNSLCYAYEPENVEVTVEWVKSGSGFSQYLPGTSPAIRATVRFKYPLSTPFRRFINDGKRADGTYWRWGEATVVLL